MRATSSFASCAISANVRRSPVSSAYSSVSGCSPARVDEERRRVVRELVARRALDGPVAELLVRLEDLLDPDARRRRGRAAARGTRADSRDRRDGRCAGRRRGRRATSSSTFACVSSKTAGSSTRTPPSSSTSKKRRYQPDARSQSKVRGAPVEVGPERVLLVGGRHVVRDDVEDRRRGRRRAPRRRARGTRPRRRARRRCASGRRRRSRASSPRAPAATARDRGATPRARARRERRPRAPPEAELRRELQPERAAELRHARANGAMSRCQTTQREKPADTRLSRAATPPQRTVSRCQTPEETLRSLHTSQKDECAAVDGHLGAGGDDAARERRCPLRSRPASARRSGASAA